MAVILFVAGLLTAAFGVVLVWFGSGVAAGGDAVSLFGAWPGLQVLLAGLVVMGLGEMLNQLGRMARGIEDLRRDDEA